MNSFDFPNRLEETEPYPEPILIDANLAEEYSISGWYKWFPLEDTGSNSYILFKLLGGSSDPLLTLYY